MVGPSNYLTPPGNISFVAVRGIFNETIKTSTSDDQGSHLNGGTFDWQVAAACWMLFRTGGYTGWSHLNGYPDSLPTPPPTSVNVEYAESNCSFYANTSTYEDMSHEIVSDSDLPAVESCTWRQVVCKMGDPTALPCQMTIRMSAALVLTICLVIKALYMVVANMRGRRRKKTQCLTFGDVVVASVKDPMLSIKNECLVNAGEAYRHSTSHSCHKHCTNKVVSDTGDEIGHCQKCLKFNHVNKAADLQHPCIATKYKKSLLANLGSSALTQMIILSLTSALLLGVSIMLAVLMGLEASGFKESCKSSQAHEPSYDYRQFSCKSLRKYLEYLFGGFGGFNSNASAGTLPRGQASSEMLAFAISNGAQFLYSLLYLLVIYNFTLISMEYDWGQLEKKRSKLRCTIVRGPAFRQSYLLQLPKWVLFPMMAFSSLMHWLLSQAVSTRETIWAYNPPVYARGAKSWEFSQYEVRHFLVFLLP